MLLGLLVALLGLLFSGSMPAVLTLPLLYATLPLVLWAALRLGGSGVAARMAVMAAAATWATARGTGPFSPTVAPPHDQVLATQAFLAVAGVSGLLLAAALAERHRAERTHRVLADVGAALLSTEDGELPLQTVPRRVVPECADGCALFGMAEDGSPRLIAEAHGRPEEALLLQQPLRRLEQAARLGPPQRRPRALRRRGRRGRQARGARHPEEALLLPTLEERHLAALARSKEDLRALRALAPISLLLVPVHFIGRTAGRLVLVGTHGRTLDRVDVAFGEELALRCASAEHRARLWHELQEAVRTRDDFMALASHELKTPLTPLSLHLSKLERQAREGKPADVTTLRKMRHALERMLLLINDLLDASRVAGGKLVLQRERMSLNALVREVSEDYAESSTRHTLEVEVPEDVELWVCGDHDRLEQVLVNLLENAIKYSPLGGPVQVRLWHEGGRAQLAVSDRGIGIPREQQEEIFQRFFRATTSASRHFGGLGLGLYISKDIVERHGGDIRVSSRVGEGSTFLVSLPLLEAEARPPTDVSRPPPRPSRPPPRAPDLPLPATPACPPARWERGLLSSSPPMPSWNWSAGENGV